MSVVKFAVMVDGFRHGINSSDTERGFNTTWHCAKVLLDINLAYILNI